ncbi:hypothetical protein BGZ94_005811 [Podila epigama]|nr:hypothetical protein BGZ94_005811 [Podila epigama]
MHDLRRPSMSTQTCYRVYLKLWAEFCDRLYRDGKQHLVTPGLDAVRDEQSSSTDPGDAHPYEVWPEKSLLFFKGFLFKKPTYKKLYLHKDYSYPFATYRNWMEGPMLSVAQQRKRVNVVDDLPEFQEGHHRYKRLQICLGMRVMNQARSASSFLLKRQCMRLNNKNDTTPAIESYGEEHVRMLLRTFLSETPQVAPLQMKIQMREHAKIALRHMCLLRDQDLRGLTQSDSYLAWLPRKVDLNKNAQPLWMLLLLLFPIDSP